MWGQVYCFCSWHNIDGIIPTRVGTRRVRAVLRLQQGDHPHACGDKCSLPPNDNPCLGSSPRVWGQVYCFCSWHNIDGIIPTRVGTRRVRAVLRLQQGDHPHACGDKCSLPPNDNPCLGSSPRVWGQDVIFVAFCYIIRIIPTRVGTSCDSKGSINFSRDHPHACGDKVKTQRTRSAVAGSSPRVWGQGF